MTLLRKTLLSIVLVATALMPSYSYAQGWVSFDLGQLDENLEDDYKMATPKDLSFYNNVGIAVGDGGSVYKTVNRGSDWFGATGQGTGGTWSNIITKGGPHEFGAVEMVNENIGYVVYDSTVIYGQKSNWITAIAKTIDGGITWKKQGTSLSGLRPVGIRMLSEDVGFVLTGNAFYKTADGWSSREKLIKNGDLIDGLLVSTFLSLDVSDSGRTIVLKDVARILISKDGGSTWSSIPFDFHRLIDVVSNELIYVYHDDVLKKTKDGGITFQNVLSEPLEDNGITAISFLDEDNGVVSYWSGNVYHTGDAGASWTKMNALFLEEAAVKVHELYYLSPDSIYGIGEIDRRATIFRYDIVRGQLIKGDGSVVYYFGADGMLHPFASEENFYSWYESFDDLIEVDQSFIDEKIISDFVPKRINGDQDEIGETMNW